MKTNKTLSGGVNHGHEPCRTKNDDVALNVEKGLLTWEYIGDQNSVVGSPLFSRLSRL